jgi:hypothetical protein
MGYNGNEWWDYNMQSNWDSQDYPNDWVDTIPVIEGSYIAGSSQLVAQPTNTSQGVADACPIWDGNPHSFDLWTDRLKDWQGQTRLPKSKQGPHVLSRLPVKPKERMRTTIASSASGRARLEATSWRESCSAEQAFHFYKKGHQTVFDKYTEIEPTITAMY